MLNTIVMLRTPMIVLIVVSLILSAYAIRWYLEVIGRIHEITLPLILILYTGIPVQKHNDGNKCVTGYRPPIHFYREK